MRFREFRRDETFYALFLLPRAKRRPGKTRDRSLLFTTLYSPRFLGPRFYEKSSVLIFGRVVAFSCRYDAEFSALSQLSYSESCRYSRYYLFFGVTRLVLFFFPRLREKCTNSSISFPFYLISVFHVANSVYIF